MGMANVPNQPGRYGIKALDFLEYKCLANVHFSGVRVGTVDMQESTKGDKCVNRLKHAFYHYSFIQSELLSISFYLTRNI